MTERDGKNRLQDARTTARDADGALRGGKSVSLAKTMRPGLLSVVQRTSLFERLDRGAERGIVWVAGPPGAGKTTLVSSYIEHRRLVHIWYQVDRGDANAATFFHYMNLAASRVPPLDGRVLPSFTPGRSGVAEFSQRYFRELYACLERPFALVFDNYQEAPLQSPISTIVNVALNEIPRGAAVLVISRSGPPRELARLRANQRMEIVGWSDLRLSPTELESMARARGQILGDDAIRSLHQRTQGWAAGAVLMLEHAKVMGAEAEPPDDNTPQVIFDYVAGEIFDEFEAASQTFLLSTACLAQMTPEMAEKASGYSKAGPLLANLARNDYFVSERFVDGERVYQYHRLLSAFLRSRAKEVYTLEEWEKLVRRCARLLAEEGQTDDAITLLLDESQWQDATELITASAAETLAQGRAESLMGWLDELPSSIASRHPWALYWQGACCRHHAPRESRRYFERAYREFSAASEADMQGMALACCGVIDAIVREMDDLTLLDTWIDALHELWNGARETFSKHAEIKAVAAALVALMARRPGDSGFPVWLETALEICRQEPEASLREGLQSVAALGMLWTGEFAKACDLVERARMETSYDETLAEWEFRLSYVESLRRLVVDDTNGAVPTNGESADSGSSPKSACTISVPMHLAIAHLNAGELDKAETILDEMRTTSASARRFDRGMHHYLRAWLDTRRGDRIAAHQEAQAALGIANEIGSPAFEALCRLAWSETLADCGELRRAERHSLRTTDQARDLRSPLFELMAGFTAARIALDTGRKENAVEAIRKALSVGKHHGITRTLWWCPESMAKLLGMALAENIEAEYVRHLIRLRALAPDESAMTLQSWPWPFQVFTLGKFRLLREGATQGAIGQSSRRPVELLKVLIALGGRDIRVEHVADILWPNVDGDYAYGSFTSALHRLRKLLGIDDAVELREGRLSLNARYFWVDTWAIERLFEQVDREAAISVGRGSMSETAQRLLDLYRGAFLEDESERSCYIALREHLRGKVLRLLSRIANQAVESSRADAAVSYYERAIDADPLFEGLYRNLMTLHETLGKPDEALNVYERCRNVLSSTLRVAPSSETMAIYQRLGHPRAP